MLQFVGEADEVGTGSSWGLEFLRNIGNLPADGSNMVHVQRQTADLYGACCEGNEAQDSPQEGSLSTTTLASKTNELTPAYFEVEVTEKYVVAKGDGSGTDDNHQLAAVNSSRKRTSFSEKRRRSFTWYFRLAIRSIPIPKA